MDESSGSDQLIELKRRAEAGDRSALEELLAQLHTPVIRFLRRRFGDDPYAEGWIDDLAQETQLRVLRFLGSCAATSDGQLMAWVLTIARRVAIDWLRSPARRLEKAGVGLVGVGTNSVDASGREWELHAGRGGTIVDEVLLPMLAALYDALPESTQEAIWLRLIREASWREVGDELDTTPAGAKRRFQRAQQRLRSEVRRRIDGMPRAQRVRVRATLRRLGIDL